MGFDPSAFFALFAGTFLIVVIILLVVSIILRLLFLRIGIKAVKGTPTDMGSVFVTWLLGILCSLLPCLGCILYLVVISKRHKTGFGNAILAWLIAGLIPGLIIGGIFALCVLLIPGMPSFADLFNSIPLP